MGLFLGSNLVSPAEYIKTEFVGIPREVSQNGGYQIPTSNFTFNLPNNATYIHNPALTEAFRNCTGLTSTDLSSLTELSDYSLYYTFDNCVNLVSANLCSISTIDGGYSLGYTFNSCSNLSSVNLSSLTSIKGTYNLEYAFANCRNLSSVNLSSLTSIDGSYNLQYAFYRCSNLSSVNLSSLTSIGNGNSGPYWSQFKGTFRYCTNLSNVYFNSLSIIKGSEAFEETFSYCDNLSNVYFNSLNSSFFGNYTNSIFRNMLEGDNNVAVHFPSNLESVIGSWDDVQNGFGGTNTTVLFDLPTTE